MQVVEPNTAKRMAAGDVLCAEQERVHKQPRLSDERHKMRRAGLPLQPDAQSSTRLPCKKAGAGDTQANKRIVSEGTSEAARSKADVPRDSASLRPAKSPSVGIIQDWHAVIGDKHSGNANRTTTATKMLKDVKQWYKKNKAQYRVEGKTYDLYTDAMERYFRNMAEAFEGFPQGEEAQFATILIHCTAKAEISNRIEVSNCFRYGKDLAPMYGTARLPDAISFFFESRDAPTLNLDVARYRRELNEMRKRPLEQQPPASRVLYFASILDFCEDQMQKSRDEELAQQFLELINLRTTLKSLWQSLKEKEPDSTGATKKKAQSSPG